MSDLRENLEIIAARIGSPWGEGATYVRDRAKRLADIKEDDYYISHLGDIDRVNFINDLEALFQSELEKAKKDTAHIYEGEIQAERAKLKERDDE